MMRGVQTDSESARVLRDQLQEIKDRWNRVNERVMELRSVTMIDTRKFLDISPTFKNARIIPRTFAQLFQSYGGERLLMISS